MFYLQFFLFDNRSYILAIDFSKPQEYVNKLISLDPTGLIPMILDLENNFLYKTALTAYKYLKSKPILNELTIIRYEIQ